MTDACFLDPHDPELQCAWAHFPDPVMEAPNGEILGYMGTFLDEDGWYHEFRHRHHPETHTRMGWAIPATHGWVPSAGKEDTR